MRCGVVCVFVLQSVFLLTSLKAQVVDWKSYTSVGEIRDIAISDAFVWAGSEGGAMSLGASDTMLTQFTNTEGLSQNNVRAVAIDTHGDIWFALQNGLLNRFSPSADADKAWLVIEEYRGQSINDMVVFGDSIYVGLDIGVSLFLVDKKEVKEIYRNLGFAVGDEIQQVQVNSILLDGTEIWVATNSGVAHSSLTFSALQAPASWTTYTTINGLPSNLVREVALLSDTLYAATDLGVYRLANGTWELSGFAGDEVSRLISVPAGNFAQETLVAIQLIRNPDNSIRTRRVFQRTTFGTWQQLPVDLIDVTALGAGPDGSLWIGRDNVGLAKYDAQAGKWDTFSANAPGSNDFNDLLIDSMGRLWCASRFAGLHILDRGRWINLFQKKGPGGNSFRTLLEDGQGRVWAGGWGPGVIIFDANTQDFSFDQINHEDGVFIGFGEGDDEDYVLIEDLYQDPSGNIWILNRRAINGNALVVYTTEGEFVHFNTAANFGTTLLTRVVVDFINRIWLGTEDRGVRLLEYGESLLNPIDDDYSQFLDVSEGLFTNHVQGIAVDEAGTIWLGTTGGLNIWSNGLDYEFDTSVNVVGIDAIDNKWIGTENGITIYRGHRDKLGEDITIGNSGLVSPNVLSLAFNPETGEVWIGTDIGLSRARTLFTAPKSTLDNMVGFPNPYIITGSQKPFVISDITGDAVISIFSSTGRLVAKTSSDRTNQAFWDGKDHHGDWVASGIYVYVANSEDGGFSAAGKVAVIRK